MSDIKFYVQSPTYPESHDLGNEQDWIATIRYMITMGFQRKQEGKCLPQPKCGTLYRIKRPQRASALLPLTKTALIPAESLILTS